MGLADQSQNPRSRSHGWPEVSQRCVGGQWRILYRLLPAPALRGRPPLDRRSVLNAIWYVLSTGCQWRALTKDFPKWSSVDTIDRRWKLSGLWGRLHDRLRERCRRQVGKKPTPTAAIIDSQTVKTSSVADAQRGYDTGKKLLGRKRHLAVDTLGLVWSVVVHAASVQDQNGAPRLLLKLHERFRRLKVIFANAAYARSGWPERTRQTCGWRLQTILRPVGLKPFVVLPKRWIVERTFRWVSH